MQIKFSELNNDVLANGYSGNFVDECLERYQRLALLKRPILRLVREFNGVPEWRQTHAPSRLSCHWEMLGSQRLVLAFVMALRRGGRTEGVYF